MGEGDIYDYLCHQQTGAHAEEIGNQSDERKRKLNNTGEVLNSTEATTYRALAARANYLALDRPDIAFCTKELCRAFARPTKDHAHALKKLVKYLVGKARLVFKIYHQHDTEELRTHVDTDFAGCHLTRRSTSGGSCMRGGHLLKFWSQTQTTVALSSAEAELGGICKGASQGLGLRALAKDLGIELQLEMFTDATAAVGTCRRRGLGKFATWRRPTSGYKRNYDYKHSSLPKSQGRPTRPIF